MVSLYRNSHVDIPNESYKYGNRQIESDKSARDK